LFVRLFLPLFFCRIYKACHRQSQITIRPIEKKQFDCVPLVPYGSFLHCAARALFADHATPGPFVHAAEPGSALLKVAACFPYSTSRVIRLLKKYTTASEIPILRSS
jgi:hypothetical protein